MTHIKIIKSALLIGCFLILSNPATIAQDNTPEELSIKAAVLNYIEGWYQADTLRMSEALSPDLRKTGFVMDSAANQLKIYPANYSQMVFWTGNRSDKFTNNQELKLEVEIIEIGKNIAMAKTISPDYIDFIQLVKTNGAWKIYNVVWEPNLYQVK